MQGLYHDAMAVIRKLGKPDLFITFTCNPKWPEILTAVCVGQTASERSDIIARYVCVLVGLRIMDRTLFKAAGYSL